MIHFQFILILLSIIPISCGPSKKSNPSEKETYNYLALGDSYTIGESVCGDCNFPKQLTAKFNEVLKERTSLKIIAKTGWTTSDLLSTIASENPPKNYDLVTLLIGVNNQYQGQPFSVYEAEFPKLLNLAIDFANGRPENVIVLSIPDYAFTPFGQKSGKGTGITSELIRYNRFAEKIASEKGVHFENITSITQQGLKNTDLVASDGLHPSEAAYKKFVEQIFEKALSIIR